MKSSSKVLVGVGLGILAGGVAGYFLSSEEGREFQRKTKAQLDQLSQDVKNTVKENANLASEKVTSASSSAKGWANELSETVKNKISKGSNAAEGTIEEVEDDFQSGVEKARRKIAEQTSKLNTKLDNA